MNILQRYRDYRHRKAYERDVRFRMRHIPYGNMYGQVIAYRRTTEQRPDKEECSRLEAAHHLKEKARAVFMSHPAATNQDFERCWPSIRDELFVRYTLSRIDGLLAAGKS